VIEFEARHYIYSHIGVIVLVPESDDLTTKRNLDERNIPGLKDRLKHMSLKAGTTCLICLTVKNK
jgi:hypothetical protein